ncbi:RING finger protein 141 [Caligus rogercresseyi]|uniref:RING finger protein 141 n=1 Tax=Caligus rogercresseyi TaxID=217165 RepID=A0A7T8HKQ9_CALRO|nr:RING finger protein 141 [Caligus rogercresseyi]
MGGVNCRPVLSEEAAFLGSVTEEVFRRTRSLKQLASIEYPEFLSAVKDLNDLSSQYLDANGKQLLFAVKKGTDSTVLWKATVRVACLKVDSSSKSVDSYKPLNLREFLSVYNSLSHTAAAVNNPISALQGDNPPKDLFASSILQLEEEESAATSLEECCICLERKPEIILPCAHSYCLPCIEKWNVDHKTCPVCREILLSTQDSWVISDVPDSQEIVTEIQKSLMELAQ